VKIIKNKTFILAPKFVWALLLILLVSSMIGTTVWAKPVKPVKPDKPGKPSDPEPVIADYNIWIGAVGQDIILDSPSPLSVENVVGGDWLPPPTKGKPQKETFWGINFIGETGDENCTYTIAPVLGVPPNETVLLSEELASHGIDDKTESPLFMIKHTRSRRGGVEDYWEIGIAWQVGHEPNIGPHIHGIICMTNIDAELEGEYYETTDTWIVTFEDAEAWLIENVDGSGDMSVPWAGRLSFTVTIERTLVES